MVRTVRINWKHELERAKQGKKTKFPAEILAYEAERSNPSERRRLAAAFSTVREWAGVRL